MRYIIISLLVSVSLIAHAQRSTGVIDSLENLLKNTPPDTTKVKILRALSFNYLNLDTRKGIAIAQQAIHLALTLDDANAIGRSYNNLGVAYGWQGNYDSSNMAYETALSYAEKENLHDLKMAISVNLGANYANTSDYTKALDVFLQGLAVAEKYGLQKYQLYGSIANMYRNMENHAAAMHYDSLTIDATEKQNAPESIKILVLGNTARTLSEMQRFDDAINILKKCIDYHRKHNKKFYLSNNYEGVAGIMIKQRRYAEAFTYYSKVLALNLEVGNTADLCSDYNALANIELMLENINSAQQFALKAFHLSDSLALLEYKLGASSILSKIAVHRHDLHLASFYDSINAVISDSLNLQEQAKAVADLKTKYETEKKQQENDLLKIAQVRQNYELSFQRYAITFIAAVLIMVLILVFIVYRNHYLSKVQNILLQQKNEAIKEQQDKILRQKEEIIAQHQRLQTALQDLHTTQAQLIHAEKMASLGQMTAGIAHEINNPLNFISGSVSSLTLVVSDLLKMVSPRNGHDTNLYQKHQGLESIQNDVPVLIGNITSGVKRATKIISGLLAFSSPQDEALADVSVHQCFESVLTLLEPKLIESEITVETRFAEHLPTVLANKIQLEQVFANIIDNAIQAMESHRPPRNLVITTEFIDNKVTTSIRDTGPGIPEEYQAKIMEPFFTTKPVGKGTGLGLSISYGIINKLGGQLTFNSSHTGTEFIITLGA